MSTSALSATILRISAIGLGSVCIVESRSSIKDDVAVRQSRSCTKLQGITRVQLIFSFRNKLRALKVDEIQVDTYFFINAKKKEKDIITIQRCSQYISVFLFPEPRQCMARKCYCYCNTVLHGAL